MKERLLLVLMTVMLCYTNLSHADYIFHSNNTNSCEHISGSWAGKGQAYNWILGSCKYHGSGTVSIPDKDGNFAITVSAYKDSGSSLCPNHSAKQLHGVCINGEVTIHTEFGNLLGTFSEHEGNAQGTLYVAPGIDAKIEIQFQRTE
ncbi:hypothetical protein [Legionella fallonii]|uniref:Uncharacterized protein n=1 Tax=Legionella fallonii LLAP-10 TaxID=1212491 RepID=A0A098G1G1_9GAMM|nr:hypothetical protein [Legionella fallonii]CEG55814.1 conserved exported protein of unknown function [Legionella fallonii LLAP-10]